MPEALPELVDRYLAELSRENASAHTIRNYGADLRDWLAFLTPPESDPPAITELDVLTMREWLASLYDRELETSSARRKLAAVRSFLKWAERQGLVTRNVAKLVKTPKMVQRLPAVPSAENTNHLLDSVPEQAAEDDRPYPTRDLAIFELLYGCGLRISELVGLNLQDIDTTERWMRIRGKGRKEREVPYGDRAGEALMRWLADRRPSGSQEIAVFLNCRGTRLTDRSARRVVRFYVNTVLQDDGLHPHSFRHAFATHMLASGADLRAIQELLGHARLSTTQKYTQVALADLMRVYDKCHPKA